jgi:hypothetical protein
MHTISIAGEERPYVLNMGALQAISQRGYSGENGEGDFGQAFVDAEDGKDSAMRLVAWAGLLAPFMDTVTGAIDYNAAPPISVTNLMTLAELMAATATASTAFIESLPEGTLEAIQKAAEAQEAAAKAAEEAGRPTPPRKSKKA